jgi:hypothetical protein
MFELYLYYSDDMGNQPEKSDGRKLRDVIKRCNDGSARGV